MIVNVVQYQMFSSFGRKSRKTNSSLPAEWQEKIRESRVIRDYIVLQFVCGLPGENKTRGIPQVDKFRTAAHVDPRAPIPGRDAITVEIYTYK